MRISANIGASALATTPRVCCGLLLGGSGVVINRDISRVAILVTPN